MSALPSGRLDRPTGGRWTRNDFRSLLHSDHEQAQRQRILQNLVAAIFAGSLFTGAINLINGWMAEARTRSGSRSCAPWWR